MNAFDDRIRQALESADTTADAGSIGGLGDAFLSRTRAIILIAWAKMIFFEIAGITGIVMFYRSESTKAQIAWAAWMIVMAMGIGIMFVLYWLELSRKSLLREIKRAEQRTVHAASERAAG